MDKIDRKSVPSPSPPQIKDGKVACFGFCAASSLNWGGGGGERFAVLFYSVHDCRFIAEISASYHEAVKLHNPLKIKTLNSEQDPENHNVQRHIPG